MTAKTFLVVASLLAIAPVSTLSAQDEANDGEKPRATVRMPDGTRQVSLRSNGYMGPGAPPGPYHHYTFILYALDTKLDIPSGAPADAAKTRNAVMDAMDGHVLGKAVLVARFHRQ